MIQDFDSANSVLRGDGQRRASETPKVEPNLAKLGLIPFGIVLVVIVGCT